jgi:hypothetical protein
MNLLTNVWSHQRSNRRYLLAINSDTDPEYSRHHRGFENSRRIDQP